MKETKLHLAEAGRPDDVEQLEMLKEMLRSGSERSRLIKMLRTRQQSSAGGLLAAYKDRDANLADRKACEYDFAVNAMALEPLERQPNAHNPYLPPSWMNFARSKLAEYIIKNPSERSGLNQTVFFGSNHEQYAFAREVSASVEPYGVHDDLSFAAGFIIGEITVKTD